MPAGPAAVGWEDETLAERGRGEGMAGAAGSDGRSAGDRYEKDPDRRVQEAITSVRGSSEPETVCLAEHVRLELRNVGANYPFERSHRFAGIQPNSGHTDYSRLSCSIEETQLGPRARSQQAFLRGRLVI
jgi:hypothetical protein